MNKDDIIKMAREAGMFKLFGDPNAPEALTGESINRFAALVRDYLLSTEIHSCHANCQRFACVQTRKAVEAEREACEKVCDDLWQEDGTAYDCREAIRTRSNI